jgi:hypothetical protein
VILVVVVSLIILAYTELCFCYVSCSLTQFWMSNSYAVLIVLEKRRFISVLGHRLSFLKKNIIGSHLYSFLIVLSGSSDDKHLLKILSFFIANLQMSIKSLTCLKKHDD